MHLYWRIQNDLNELGDVLIFRHPGLIRAFEAWVKKNAAGLAVAEDLTLHHLNRLCLSNN